MRPRHCLLDCLVDDKVHELVEAAQRARDVTVAVELDCGGLGGGGGVRFEAVVRSW